MVDAIQIVGVAFALFALSRALLRLKDNDITLREFLFWAVIWVGVIIIAILPQTVKWLSQPLGITRPIDTAVYLGIILSLYLIFRLYVRMEHLEKNITRVVRETAITRPSSSLRKTRKRR